MKLNFSGRWEGYQFSDLRKDLVAGITVGIISIPLGMAFAIASGVGPEYGLYTTIIASIIIALFGGSRFQIGGPTGAFIPILLGIVLVYGYENLLLAGMMAGVILVLMGLFKLGAIIKYIPRPVMIGFTAGIAVIIFTGQIGNFFGLTDLKQHAYFTDNMAEIIKNISSLQYQSILIAIISLAVLVLLPRFLPRVPASLVALVIATVISILLFGDQVPTIGSVFGEIPASLPQFTFPDITFERLLLLLGPALTIALLGSIESLLSAVVADGMTNTKHQSNRELVGQGLANIASPMFGGIPATGAIARTAANIKSGAVSPFSGVIHGVTVLIVLLAFAPFASMIPIAGMAPILMVVAWNMSSRHHFAELVKLKNGDTIVTITTFLLTVFFNLTIAVGVGLVLAALLFIKRMSDMLVVRKKVYKQDKIHIHSIEGPLFFGAAQNLLTYFMDSIQSSPARVIILQLTNLPFMDATGEDELHTLIRHLQGQNSLVLVVGIQLQPKEMLVKTRLYQRIGRAHFFERLEDAIQFGEAQFVEEKS